MAFQYHILMMDIASIRLSELGSLSDEWLICENNVWSLVFKSNHNRRTS